MPRFYDVDYLPDGRIQRVVPNRADVPFRVHKRTTMDLDAWPYPKKPLVPLAETVHERFAVEIFRGCTRGCRFCQAGMITRPVRERSITTVGEMVKQGLEFSGFHEVGLLSLSSADHSEIGDMCKGLADQYAGTNVSLSLPSTRVDAFNIDLAQELSRNGRRTGLTFAPEGGSERIRKVINKMVSEEDLIRTVVTAYTNGWRQVKLYFMCGLPTETDEDVLQIARLAHEVIKTGRAATGSRDIRCTVSIGGFVPKPHTPFQWAAMDRPEVIDDRLQAAQAGHQRGPVTGQGDRHPVPRRRAVADRRACSRAVTGGSARSSARCGSRAGASTAGASTSPTAAGWTPATRCCRPSAWTWTGTPPASASEAEVLPWDHLDSGLDKDWLWQDWQDALTEYEQDDCRWTPCFDCGVCPSMDTEHPDRPDRPQTAALDPGVRACRSGADDEQATAPGRAGAGGAADPDPLRQARPAALHLAPRLRPRRRAGDPSRRTCRSRSRRGSPRTRRSRSPAPPRPGWPPRPSTWSSACASGSTPIELRAALDAALSPGLDVVEAVEARHDGQPGRSDHRFRWRIELPGVTSDARRGRGEVPRPATRCWSNA